MKFDGIRNLADLENGIREMTRVAVNGGRVVILEFPCTTNRSPTFEIRLALVIETPP